MWRPRRPKPGMVRVHHRELIRVQAGALRAVELELEATTLRASIAAHRRELALSLAWDIVDEAAGVQFPVWQLRRLLVDLPVDEDGVLDEAEFAGRVFDAANRIRTTEGSHP